MSRSLRVSWWLETPDKVRRRITQHGLLLGRGERCDLMVPDQSTSRQQALVYLANSGPRCVSFGKRPTRVSGRDVSSTHDLAEDDTLELGTLVLWVRKTEAEVDANDGSWVLHVEGGGFHAISHSLFSVGNAEHADLQIPSWLDQTVRFHLLADGSLTVEVLAEGVVIAGVAAAPSELVIVPASGTIVAKGCTLRAMKAHQVASQLTTIDPVLPLTRIPHRIALEFLPRGGRLSVSVGDHETSLYLPDKRCDLMAALLSPPPGLRVGELVADEAVAARVWPNETKTQADFNTLVYRLRRDLVRAGLDGMQLLVRAQGGRASALGVGPATDIQVG